MNMVHCYIICIICFSAIATALPGLFLVLRGMALMSDAISHAILPGIVIMFLYVQKLESPLLIIGASLAGMCTVLLTEALIKTERIKKDAAIGLIFPLFFSTGVILISLYARNVHLDVDMVLLGELAFAPFEKLILFGTDCGPYALWTMGSIAMLNSFLVFIFYKELYISTFDPYFAHSVGFNPAYMHYGLMLITSITAVGAFDIVGSIVVVALMITPAAAAYLLSTQLYHMIQLTVVIALFSAVNGYLCAAFYDISIAGSIAIVNGLYFLIALLWSPQRGILYTFFFLEQVQKKQLQEILCTYLIKKKGASSEDITKELGWSLSQTHRVIADCVMKKNIIKKNNYYVIETFFHVR